MLVPTPRKTKEMRKNAASTMATSLTQKLILSRFIIMAGYPPRSSPTETIVYHVAAAYSDRDSPPGGGLENLLLGTSTLKRRLDHGEISPFSRLQRPRLGLDTEGARPPERRQLEPSRAAHAMHLHREQRLFEKVHARAAPEPVRTHTDPDASGDHAKHGRDAAPEEVVRTGTMRRRYAGLRQNSYVLFGDTGRQMRGYRLGGKQPHALGVAHGRYTRSPPLVATEDIGEPAGTVRYELDLLGTLGEVDRERPPHLPRSLRRQTRGLGVYGIRRMSADPDGHPGGADLMREKLGVDGPRHPARGELRQALPVRGRLGHVRSPRLDSLPGRVAGRPGRPGLLLGEALYEPGKPARKRSSCGGIFPPETEVGVRVYGARDHRVVGEEPDLGIGVLTPDFGERSQGLYAPVLYEQGPVLQRGRRDGHQGSGRENHGSGLAFRHPSRPPPRPWTPETRVPGCRAGGLCLPGRRRSHPWPTPRSWRRRPWRARPLCPPRAAPAPGSGRRGRAGSSPRLLHSGRR